MTRYQEIQTYAPDYVPVTYQPDVADDSASIAQAWLANLGGPSDAELAAEVDNRVPRPVGGLGRGS